MDEVSEHAKTTEHISTVRKQLRKAKAEAAAYKTALDFAISHLKGDGYPGKSTQAALKKIDQILSELK